MVISADGGPAAAGPALVGAPDAPSGEFDIVATYHRLLETDPDLTKPIAAIEALIDVLRQTPSSTAMETYEISQAQVQRLHAAIPNALPIEAGTRMFTGFLSMSMRQPGGLGSGLDSFEKIRQHLLDNSQLFVQRAKEARNRMAERGCRLVEPGDVVLTAGGSRAVRRLFLRAAERLAAGGPGGMAAAAGEGASTPAPFTVLYVVDERSRAESERHMAALRSHHIPIPVLEIDPSAVAYALEAYGVRSVFVGSEAVTHDGKLVSRIGTYQLALLADRAKPKRNFYVLAETHKFVRKLLLSNADLPRIQIHQELGVGSASTRTETDPLRQRPLLAFEDQVDVTPPSLVTNFITENGILQPSGSYRIVSY